MKKITVLALLALLALAGSAMLPGQKGDSRKQEMETLRRYQSTLTAMNKGLDLLVSRDWDAAALQFDRCLEVLPEHPNACYGKAVISSQAGDVQQALVWIERAEKGSVAMQRDWENLQVNLALSSKEDKSVLRDLLTGSSGAARNCGSYHFVDDTIKKTWSANEKILRKDQGGNSLFAVPAEFLSLHGNLLFKLKRFPEAEAKYLEALAVEPAHEICLNNLINIYFVTRRFDQAREWLRQAANRKVKINPKLEQAVSEAKESN